MKTKLNRLAAAGAKVKVEPKSRPPEKQDPVAGIVAQVRRQSDQIESILQQNAALSAALEKTLATPPAPVVIAPPTVKRIQISNFKKSFDGTISMEVAVIEHEEMK